MFKTGTILTGMGRLANNRNIVINNTNINVVTLMSEKDANFCKVNTPFGCAYVNTKEKVREIKDYNKELFPSRKICLKIAK